MVQVYAPFHLPRLQAALQRAAFAAVVAGLPVVVRHGKTRLADNFGTVGKPFAIGPVGKTDAVVAVAQDVGSCQGIQIA